MSIAVAILNWNGIGHLKTYLPSVVEHSKDEGVVVYVIDNGSTDESCSWITENYPSVVLVKLDKNHGFAGGYNLGLESISADRYVLLNSDVRVSKGWIESVTTTMDSKELTACSPLIMSDSSPENYEYSGAAGGYIDKDGFMFCAGRVFNTFERSHDAYSVDKEVFWASGAALFIDSKAWNEVNGLDSDFFAHMEEIDLCWRLKNRGYKVGVCGSSKVYHLGGGTLSSSSPLKVYLNFRNNLLLLLKNKNGFWPIFMLRRMILDGIAAVRFLIRGEFSFFFAVFRAHLIFYTMIFSTLRKRSVEKDSKSSNRPNLKGRYNKSIIIQYFFKGNTKFSDLETEDFS